MKQIKTLEEVLTDLKFNDFLERVKKCPTVQRIFVIGGMAYKGWSDKDIDLWVDADSSVDDTDLDRIMQLEEDMGELLGIKVGDIIVDLWCGEMNGHIPSNTFERVSCGTINFDRPYVLLWSRN